MNRRSKRLGIMLSMIGIGTILLTGAGCCAKSKMTKPELSKPLSGSIRFTVQAQHAKQVFLVGSFNGWSKHATPMKTVGNTSLWSVDVPLREGEYTFMYLIDGSEWSERAIYRPWRWRHAV